MFDMAFWSRNTLGWEKFASPTVNREYILVLLASLVFVSSLDSRTVYPYGGSVGIQSSPFLVPQSDYHRVHTSPGFFLDSDSAEARAYLLQPEPEVTIHLNRIRLKKLLKCTKNGYAISVNGDSVRNPKPLRQRKPKILFSPIEKTCQWIKGRRSQQNPILPTNRIPNKNIANEMGDTHEYGANFSATDAIFTGEEQYGKAIFAPRNALISLMMFPGHRQLAPSPARQHDLSRDLDSNGGSDKFIQSGPEDGIYKLERTDLIRGFNPLWILDLSFRFNSGGGPDSTGGPDKPVQPDSAT
ncbi:hypothetical protein ABW19_dt0206183 [Dactylella cylindrospora]|nr:hypothetical protein ABW19_dt0206183 [Dactylella cylindrospora]